MGAADNWNNVKIGKSSEPFIANAYMNKWAAYAARFLRKCIHPCDFLKRMSA